MRTAKQHEKKIQTPLLLRKKIKVTVVVIILLGLLGAVVVIALPWKKYDAKDYFTQLEKGKVNGDVDDLLVRVKQFTDQDPHDFSMFENFPLRGYKYSIAFTAYGVANVALIDPSRKKEMAGYMDRLIQRILQYDPQEDWWTDGYGTNADDIGNVMYRGHLNLMFGLYELIADDKKYEQQFKALTKKLVEESRASKNGRNQQFFGITCEPPNYYIECNTISVYSFKLHDALYGSDHSQLINDWFNYITTELRDKNTGLFAEAYRPTTDYPVPQIISYNNGWTLAFLHPLYPQFVESMHAPYKQQFVREKFFWYAFAVVGKGIPEIRPPMTVNQMHHTAPPLRELNAIDPLGTLFAFYEASEMRDESLFNKLLNALSKTGVESVDTHSQAGFVTIDVRNNFAIQGPLLFGKTNIGLAKVLEFAAQKRNQSGNVNPQVSTR